MTIFQDFVAAIEATTGRPGKRQGRNTRLLCPAHDDTRPSLDVAEGTDGRPLVVCRSHGCTFEAICTAIGHDIRDYAPEQESEGGWTPRGPAVAVYTYHDADRKLAYEVCRTADKQFPVRRPDPASSTGWRWNLRGVKLVLYRLPEILEAAKAEKTIYVCEGEKDVEAIRRAGGIATCNPGGAGKWRDQYAACLDGAHVIVVADNDEIGLAHAAAVAASLAARRNGDGPMRVVTAKEGKDAHDHFAAGHGLEDFREIEQPKPPRFAFPLSEFLELDLPSPEPLLGTTDDTIIPAGGLIVLAGMPGAGKTTLAVDCAFHLASGVEWLEMSTPRPLNVLLVENEGPQHLFKQKLQRKNTSWNHPIEGDIHIQTWRWGSFTFRDGEAIEMARAYMDECEIDLVIGDPLDTLGPAGVGSPEDTREFVRMLMPLGLTQTRSFLFLHHFRKEVSLSEINMVSGSWGGRLDTLLVLRETENRDELRLSLPKVRHGEDGRPALIIGKVRNTFSYELLAHEEPPTPSEEKEATLRRIIDVLTKTGGTMERSVLLIRSEAPSGRTFSRALNAGIEQNLIARGKEGKKSIYSLAEDAP